MIDPHGQRRQARNLLHANVGCAVDAAQLDRDAFRDRLQHVEVVAVHHHGKVGTHAGDQLVEA